MPTTKTHSTDSHRRTVDLQIREDTLALIDRAAHIQNCSRSDFIIKAALHTAENAILDQTAIVTDRPSYDRFVEMLDRPPQSNEKLRKLMQTRAPWESE